jgi:hypothetical protein
LWKNTFDPQGERLQQIVHPVRNGTDVTMNSFETHQFVIRFLKHIEGIEATFTKGAEDEKLLVQFDEMQNRFKLSLQNSQDLLTSDIEEASALCRRFSGEAFVSCLTEGAKEAMTRLEKQKRRLSKYRDSVSFRLRNYTCSDPEMQTTPPISTYEFIDEGKSYEVRVLLDMPAAKVWAVENFLTSEECNILEKEGRPLLRRATVAAEDGTSVVSEHRKAQQASYNHHQRNGERDPLFDLQRRILHLTNIHSNYSLAPEGQEGFTIIQYNIDDQYL